jgi:ABC-type taurine transport system ATPase subunit
MVTPDAGAVSVGGDVATVDAVPLRRRLGYVQQDGGLLPHWTVARNVALVPRLRGQPDAQERARRALERVGLSPSEFGPRWPRQLSGGQRQRVALARAIAAGEPPLTLLLDEPFGALDAITRGEMQEAFLDLCRDLQLTVLPVTEGLDKPIKYPVMFKGADLVLLTKTDLLPHLSGVSLAGYGDSLRKVMPRFEVIPVCATTGEGLDRFAAWLEARRAAVPRATHAHGLDHHHQHPHHIHGH